MKTIRVRAVVAVDPVTGEWSVSGNQGKDYREMVRDAVSEIWNEDRAELSWITAEIQVRETPEVEAEVEK